MGNATAMKEPAAFDTLAAANDLQEAGFDRKQSEGLAKIVARIALTLQSDLSHLEKNQALAIKEGIATAMAETRTQRTIMYGAFLPIQLALLILMITMAGFVMNLSAKVNTLDTRMTLVETRVSGLETRMDGLETRMGSLETRMDGLETRMDGLETRMDGLEARMDSLEASMGSLEASMGSLEASIGGLETLILKIGEDVAEIKALGSKRSGG